MLTWILMIALCACCVVVIARADRPERHLALYPALLGGLALGLDPLVRSLPRLFGRRPDAWLPILVTVGLAAAVALGLALLNHVTTARLTRLANEALGDGEA